MESRKFIDVYEYTRKSSSYEVKSLIEALQMQLEFMIKKDNNNIWLKEKLQELNDLSNILSEYLPGVSGKYDVDNLSDSLFSYMAKKHPDGAFPKKDVMEFYNNSQIYVEFKEYMDKLFKLEDEIHENITLKLWQEYCTDINVDFRQGDEFRYIVHSGYGIIKLPGLPNYIKNRYKDGDFVSASLLTEKQMRMYNGNVGLILEPNESIIATAIEDAGTRIEDIQGINSVLDFGNGTFVNTRLDRVESIPTKIQSPQQLNDDFIEKLKKINSDPLNEGWPINEVILDDRKIKVKGVFFRVNENQLALHDFIRAHNMKVMYNVPLRVVNVDKYRKKDNVEIPKNLQEYIKGYLKDDSDCIVLQRYLNEVAIPGEFSERFCNILIEEMMNYDYRKSQKITKGEEFEI